MKQDLIERYIYAVTRRLDRKQREDVARELGTLIEDMLTERCGGETPGEKDIRIVLTELGTPQELYEKYDESAGKCLIGQPYYATYLFVMKIVLASVAVGITVSSLIVQMLEPQSWWQMAGSLLSMLYNGVLSAFAIVTLLFAFFYRKGIKLTERFNFDDLPPVPRKNQQIPKWESIAGIVFCMLFLVLFVFTPEVFCVVREGTVISLFDIAVVKRSWFLVVSFAACGICREAVQLMERRYNKKVLTATLITNAISAVLSVWWLTGFQLLNPVFLSNMETLFAGENSFVFSLFGNFDLFFLAVLLFALILDTVDVAVKTLRK